MIVRRYAARANLERHVETMNAGSLGTRELDPTRFNANNPSKLVRLFE